MSLFHQIVSDYIRCHRSNAEKEQKYFKIQRTFEEALSTAALAKCPSGKRFSHQRRIPKSVLNESQRRLLEARSALRQCQTFEHLHELVTSLIRPIAGIGELTVYDTALRIGAKLGLEPAVVFLHAGTRVGARCLGLNTSREFIPTSEFPAAFRKLKPREIEDVLCIYKTQLCGRPSNPTVSRSCG